MNTPNPILQTHALSIGYQHPRKSPVVISEDINLSLNAGEMVCLLGPNGAGKSTLMRTLAGMQAPLSGQVRIGSVDLQRISSQELAQRLSIVLTEKPNLGLLSGYALVALGRHPYTDWTGRLSRYDEAMIRWAVAAVGAEDVAEKPVMELSDGQRQKLMIARALAQESEAILLDEPTAFLDLPRRVEVMHLLQNLAHSTGKGILLSTHDLDLALRTADMLWLMSDSGTIITGAPEDLVLNGHFESAFHSEGILFNKADGAFTLPKSNGRYLRLTGEGLAQHWTRRALERQGFSVNLPHSENAPMIEVTEAQNQYQWRLHNAGKTRSYPSIQRLLQDLCKI